MKLVRHKWRLAVGGVLAAALLAACSPAEPEVPASPPELRRLTEAQYRNTIADIFGSDITIPGRFEPLIRPDQGLLEEASGLAAVSSAGFEQFEVMARNIALQVFDDQHRAVLLPCQPQPGDALDRVCTEKIYRAIGRLLFRRPITDEEVSTYLAMAMAATDNVKNANTGMALGLAAMMVSPNFLFRVEALEPDPDNAGQQRLTAYSKASRLSFFLWNTTPNEDLLDAAARGDLHNDKKLKAEVAKLLDSPRWREGVRAFFSDMFMFEKFDELAKDSIVFPKFNPEIARDSKDQILRTVANVVVDKNGDYRDVFTTRETYLTRALGMVYRIPVEAPQGWQAVSFTPGSGRAGITSQLGFLALYSHAGRSSPTLRGKALRELLLCQPVPDPPSDVDFSVAQDTTNPEYKTARSRLTAHRTDPTCAGCHRIMDPIGLALENFDGIGEFRGDENGETIDASGDLDGSPFSDAPGLGAALAANPAATSCVTRRAYEYAVGRPAAAQEKPWIEYLMARFADKQYRFRDLIQTIATSETFYKVVPPVGEES